MNITIVLRAVLPAIKYGGTERVVWALGKGLSELGHKVTFLVKKGSQCSFAKIIQLDERPIVEQIPHNTDIVHFHTQPLEKFNFPYVVTEHGNRYNSIPFDTNTIFVSRNHANRYGSDSYVLNGVDWDSYPAFIPNLNRKGYHFLGKAAWRVKNVQGAIDLVCKMSPMERLTVLGGYRLNIKMGFRFTLSPKIHFYGMIDDKQKAKIINQSKGLIFPVQWHEPFGLALIESFYYGTPVFGTPYGSLPELIHSEVGFLTANSEEMIEHLEHKYNYDSLTCHNYAVNHFGSRLLAENYLRNYQQVIKGEPLNKNVIQLQEKENKFLPWA